MDEDKQVVKKICSNRSKKLSKKFIETLVKNEAEILYLRQEAEKEYYKARFQLLKMCGAEIDKIRKGEKVNATKLHLLSLLNKAIKP